MSEQNVAPQVEPQPAPQGGELQQTQSEKMLTFTQAQMSALMSREKHEGKDSVYRALGLDPKDKEALEQAKARLASNKAQAQQATQPVSDKQENKAQEQPVQQPPQQAQGDNAVIKAETKIALLGAGVQPELLDDALTLLLHKVEKSEQITTEVDALKAKHAVLFAPQKQTTGQLIGGLGAGGSQQPSTAADFGAQLARAKNANRSQQKQFFGGK